MGTGYREHHACQQHSRCPGARFRRSPTFRDLGHWAGDGGRVVAPGALYRANDFATLDDDDRAGLSGLGLRTVIDLRTEVERNGTPDPSFPERPSSCSTCSPMGRPSTSGQPGCRAGRSKGGPADVRAADTGIRPHDHDGQLPRLHRPRKRPALVPRLSPTFWVTHRCRRCFTAQPARIAPVGQPQRF